MTNFTNNSTNFTKLYCVWVPARDDGNAPLVSIWIDPTMTAIERQQPCEDISVPADASIADEIEDSRRRMGVARHIRQSGESSAAPLLSKRSQTVVLVVWLKDRIEASGAVRNHSLRLSQDAGSGTVRPERPFAGVHRELRRPFDSVVERL